jgi:hypothetical protein
MSPLLILSLCSLLVADATNGSLWDIKQKPEHFVRIANTNAAGLTALAAAADDIDPLSAKLRGLLAIVTSLILLAPEKRLTEQRLFELLESTGLRSRAVGGGDAEDDEGTGHIIPGWETVVSKDFVRADYLERTGGGKSDEGAAGGDAGGGKGSSKVFWYCLGSRARAVIGAPHVLEWVCTTTGRAVPAAHGGHLKLALGPEGPDLSDLVKAAAAQQAVNSPVAAGAAAGRR